MGLKTLNVFTASCAKCVVTDVQKIFNDSHSDIKCDVTVGGSVDLIRRAISGEPCDMLVSADNLLFENMNIELYDNYTIFAGNSMVITPNKDKTINSDNWQDVLLSSDTTFWHHSPYGDPGGYRAVMAMLLADNVKAGLSNKLMNAKGHLGMDKVERVNDVTPDFSFCYASGPIRQNKPYCKLPDCMNLGCDELSQLYSTVSFDVDDTHKVIGTPICHAIAIQKCTQHIDMAKEFLKLFMKSDFTKYGFVKR